MLRLQTQGLNFAKMDEDMEPSEGALLMPDSTQKSYQGGRQKRSKRSRLENLAGGRHTKTSTGTEETTMSIAAHGSL